MNNEVNRSKLEVHLTSLQAEVTNSCTLIDIKFTNADEFKLLVDCGKENEGYREYPKFKGFPFNPKEISVILLTHCHLDHYGNGPYLFHLGCKAKVYCTEATYDLLPVALMNSYNVDMIYHDINYNNDDIQRFLSKIKIVNYDETKKLYEQNGNVVTVKALYNAHIPGSAMFYLTVKDAEDGEENFLFSGDYKVHSALCKEHTIPKEIYSKPINLMLESTYALETSIIDPMFIDTLAKILNQGKKKIKNIEDEYEEYDAIIGKSQINAVMKSKKSKGGARRIIKNFKVQNYEEPSPKNIIRNVVVPVISLERAQVVLYVIKCAQEDGIIPENIPIRMFAPLAENYSSLFENKESIELREECKDFYPSNFRVEQQIGLIEEGTNQQILIVGGGMGHGPSSFFIEKALPREDSAIFFTSYLAEGTLGRTVVDAKQGSDIKIGENKVRKNALVEVTGEFSGHAHLLDLLEFIGRFKDLKSIAVVHGNPKARKNLIKYAKIFKPEYRENIFNFDRDVEAIYTDNNLKELKETDYKKHNYDFEFLQEIEKEEQEKKKEMAKKRGEKEKRTKRKNVLTHKNMSRNNRVYSSRNKASKDASRRRCN